MSISTNCYRLVHGEGDNLPGLIIDYYDGVCVMQAHSVGMHVCRHEIADALSEVLDGIIDNIYYKSETTLAYKASEDGGNGFLIPISSPAYKAAEKAMTEVYGIEPVPSRGGGSIPILADLQRILGIDPLLMGFGLERDTIHSPNESYLLKQLFAGMDALALFYRYY